jgi:hypothetical protein
MLNRPYGKHEFHLQVFTIEVTSVGPARVVETTGQGKKDAMRRRRGL